MTFMHPARLPHGLCVENDSNSSPATHDEADVFIFQHGQGINSVPDCESSTRRQTRTRERTVQYENTFAACETRDTHVGR